MNVLKKVAECCIENVEVDQCLQIMKHRHGDKFSLNSLYSLEALSLIPEKEYICLVSRCLSIMLKRGAIESSQALTVNALKGTKELKLCVHLYVKCKLWRKLLEGWRASCQEHFWQKLKIVALWTGCALVIGRWLGRR